MFRACGLGLLLELTVLAGGFCRLERHTDNLDLLVRKMKDLLALYSADLERYGGITRPQSLQLLLDQMVHNRTAAWAMLAQLLATQWFRPQTVRNDLYTQIVLMHGRAKDLLVRLTFAATQIENDRMIAAASREIRECVPQPQPQGPSHTGRRMPTPHSPQPSTSRCLPEDIPTSEHYQDEPNA